MGKDADADPLLAARSLRNAAWDLVREDIALLKQGLADRPVGERVKDRANAEIADAMETARDVASENKAVVAGTALALVGWILRRPIMRGINAGIRRLNWWKG